jgi:ketosteroid isomerase-like protein
MGMHPSEALYRSVMEASVEGDFGPFADSLADDVVWHQIGAPDLMGKDAVMASFEGMEGVEFEVETHDVLANDDHVIGLVEAHVKVGDQEITYRTAEIAHVEDGKVTERWAFSDDTKAISDFFAQFGA